MIGTKREVDARDLIGIAEDSMSAPVFELLKRPDELYVVEQAHLHPRFVEDSVRLMVAGALEHYPDLSDGCFVLSRQVNFETIHNHDVLAERHGIVSELRADLEGNAAAAGHTTARAWLEGELINARAVHKRCQAPFVALRSGGGGRARRRSVRRRGARPASAPPGRRRRQRDVERAARERAADGDHGELALAAPTASLALPGRPAQQQQAQAGRLAEVDVDVRPVAGLARVGPHAAAPRAASAPTARPSRTARPARARERRCRPRAADRLVSQASRIAEQSRAMRRPLRGCDPPKRPAIMCRQCQRRLVVTGRRCPRPPRRRAVEHRGGRFRELAAGIVGDTKSRTRFRDGYAEKRPFPPIRRSPKWRLRGCFRTAAEAFRSRPSRRTRRSPAPAVRR